MLGFLKRLLYAQAKLGSTEEESPKAQINNAAAERTSVSAEDLGKAQGVSPEVNGKAVFKYAATHKNDLDMMLECCRAVENTYWSHKNAKQAPAPFHFERAAILARKAKDYSGEIAICERWIAMEDDFMAWRQNNQTRGVNISCSPRARKIRERLPKAIMLQEQSEGE